MVIIRGTLHKTRREANVHEKCVKITRGSPMQPLFQDCPDGNSNMLKYSSTLNFAPLPSLVPRAFFGEAGATTSGSETSKRNT